MARGQVRQMAVAILETEPPSRSPFPAPRPSGDVRPPQSGCILTGQSSSPHAPGQGPARVSANEKRGL